MYALVNNAGIFYAEPADTDDGIEVTFQTNYLSPFLLTLLLLPALRFNSTGSRVINLSSRAHLNPTVFPKPEFHNRFEDTCDNRMQAYQYSKFYLVLFAQRLSTLLEHSKVTVHCVDPGNAETCIFRTFPPLANRLFFALQWPIRFFVIQTPNEASQSVLHALLVTKSPPFYIENLSASTAIHRRAYDPILSNALWLNSRKLCKNRLTSAT